MHTVFQYTYTNTQQAPVAILSHLGCGFAFGRISSPRLRTNIWSGGWSYNNSPP
jgi:hypothetical protein